MAYEDFKGFARRTASDKIFRDKAFNIAKDPKYDGYQHGIASKFYEFFDNKNSGSGMKNKIIPIKGLAEGLHKPIIRKLNKRK